MPYSRPGFYRSGRMIEGPGDIACRQLEREEVPMADCKECYAEVGRDDLIDGLCTDCDNRMRPRCDWCGELATSIVDVYIDGQHIERIPVCSEACAIGSKGEAHPPLIDTVVAVDDLQRVIFAAPCWCGMRATTVCNWCPQHGTKKPKGVTTP